MNLLKRIAFIVITLFSITKLAYATPALAAQFDSNKNFHQQAILIYKVQKYLFQQWGRTEYYCTQEQKATLDIIRQGMCLGLCRLWAYAKKIDDIPATNNKPRDDSAFFNHARRLLTLWDERSAFSKAEKVIVDRFINLIFFFQEQTGAIIPESTGFDQNFERIFDKDTKGRQVVAINNCMLFGSQHIIKEQIQTLIKPQHFFFIFLMSPDGNPVHHAVAFYQSVKNGPISYYDPNSESGEYTVNTLHEFVKKLWKTTEQHNFFGAPSMRLIMVKSYALTSSTTKNLPVNTAVKTPTTHNFLAAFDSINHNYKETCSGSTVQDWLLSTIKDEKNLLEAIQLSPSHSSCKKALILHCFKNTYHSWTHWWSTKMPTLARYLYTHEKNILNTLLYSGSIPQDAFNALIFAAQ